MSKGQFVAEPDAMPPGRYLAPDGRRRWWDGREWTEEEGRITQTPSQAPTLEGTSGTAVTSMILGVIGLLVLCYAYFKPILLMGPVDLFGPAVLGVVSVVLAVASGLRGRGFRVAGFVCGGLAFAGGLLLLFAVSRL